MPPPPPPLTPLKQAWYRWKSLRWIPGRKRFLVGLDLNHNTFWEFRDTLSSHQNRMRRIVQYPRGTHHSDVFITPQWHQWLRHTRADAPSLTEQARDVVRQEQLKVLARQADERWAAKGSFLDAPEKQVLGLERGKEGKGDRGVDGDGVGRQEVGAEKEKEKEDPWKQQARGGPSEEWQPAKWDSGVAPAKR